MEWIVEFYPAFEREFDDYPETVQDGILARAGLIELHSQEGILALPARDCTRIRQLFCQYPTDISLGYCLLSLFLLYILPEGYNTMLAQISSAYLLYLLLSALLAQPIHAGPNQNAVISLDLVADSGQGNQIDDRVTSGNASGSNEKIIIEVFATGVTTELVGVAIIFDFDTSLLRLDRAENKTFSFHLPEPEGINLVHTTPFQLPPSGFIARAEFITITDVTNQPFSIGIKNISIAENTTSIDTITTSTKILFNGVTDNPDTGNTVKPITGDLDLDGDVDFTDFLLFSSNFGKTGPIPTNSPTQPTERIVTVHDTIYVTKTDTVFTTFRDTIYVSNYITKTDTVFTTIRDTIYVSNNVQGPEVPPPPSVKKYRSCADLRADWPKGVNKNGGTYYEAWNEAEKRTYEMNSANLDRDKDSHACEIQ